MEVKIYSNQSAKDYMFNAKAFLAASKRCFSDAEGNMLVDGKVVLLPAPTVVNASFACELLFKALLLHEKKDCPREHNLLDLFSLLSDDNKYAISYFHYKTENSVEQLEGFLSNHANDFTNVRYYMENKAFNEMSPLLMLALAENLCTIIDHIINSSEDADQKM